MKNAFIKLLFTSFWLTVSLKAGGNSSTLSLNEYPLHQCVAQNNVDQLYNFSKNNNVFFKQSVNQRDRCGNTPLHYALENESLIAVTYLLDNGANPNIENRYGISPLIYIVCALDAHASLHSLNASSETKFYNMLEVLLLKNASIYSETSFGKTSLKDILDKTKNEKLKQFFIDRNYYSAQQLGL